MTTWGRGVVMHRIKIDGIVSNSNVETARKSIRAAAEVQVRVQVILYCTALYVPPSSKRLRLIRQAFYPKGNSFPHMPRAHPATMTLAVMLDRRLHPDQHQHRLTPVRIYILYSVLHTYVSYKSSPCFFQTWATGLGVLASALLGSGPAWLIARSGTFEEG